VKGDAVTKKIIVILPFLVFVCMLPTSTEAWPIPDTGQTKCYDDEKEIPCPQPGEPFYGQDGNYLINPPSYTKLDAEGNDLPDDASEWVMVRDNVTGLIWEVKQHKDDVQDYENPHDADNTYTWYDSNPETNGGDAGTPGDGTDTGDFIDALNAENFGGFSDWRMPDREELRSVVYFTAYGIEIKNIYFPNIVPGRHWSTNTNVVAPYMAWLVVCGYGSDLGSSKADWGYVRAVRGEHTQSIGHFFFSEDSTVTDPSKGLMWQKTTDDGMNWKNALDFCDSMTLGGYDNWRLPSIKELASIVNLEKLEPPALDMKFFPNTSISPYWSSTSRAIHAGHAWRVDFDHGSVNYDNKSSVWHRYVRAVRGGQPRLSDHLFILSPSQAADWHIGTQKTITWETQEIPGNVRVSLSLKGGLRDTFETIAEEIANNGSFDWQVTGPLSPICVLKIEPIEDPSKSTSQSFFTIQYLDKAYISVTPIESLQQYRLSFTTEGEYLSQNIDAVYAISDPSVAELAGGTATALKTGCAVVSTSYEGRDYKKILYFKTGLDQMEMEPNDGIATATPLSEGRFTQAELLIDDFDYFKISLDSDSIVETAYFSRSQIADIKLEILDNTLQLLAVADSTDGENLLLPLGLPAGDYYVKISSTGDIDQNNSYDVVYKIYDPLPDDESDGPLSIGESSQSRINHLNEERRFTFSVDDRQELYVDFVPSSPTAGYLVELLDGGGQVVETAESAEGSRITFDRISGPDDYTISVAPNQVIDAEHPFVIRLNEHDFFLETEENNTAQTSNTIENGETFQGKLSSDDDVDFYSLSISTPQFIDLSFGCQASPKSYNVSIYKDTDQNLINGISSSNGEIVELPMGLNVGTYFIKVEKGGDTAETTYPYTLSLSPSARTNLEIESNNTIRFANAIENDQTREGRIFSLEDSDYYGFHLTEQSIFSVKFVSSSTTGDYFIHLVDENDEPFQTKTVEDGGSLTFDAYKNPGNYFVKVEPGTDIDQHAPYELSILTDVAISGLKELVTMVIEGGNSDMTVSDTRQLTAVGGYSDGGTETLSDVQWTSIDESVATVDASGLVTAKGEGAATIVASLGELAGKFDINVGAQTGAIQHRGNLILVAGGGDDATDPLFAPTQYLSDLVYRRFQHRFFEDKDIYYFNPVSFHDLDGDGLDNGVVDDATPTEAEFGSAVTDWAGRQHSDGPLYIYLIDHGGIDSFKINQGEVLYADPFAGYLETFQNATGRRVVVVIEACKSGSFTDNLSGDNRIIITSADDRDAYIQLGGSASFTQFFIDRLLAGDSLQQGWTKAAEKLTDMGVPYSKMRPQIEGTATADIVLGGHFAIAPLFPEIIDKSPNESVEANTPKTLYAKVSDADGVETAWAVVQPPDYSLPETSQDLEAPEVNLPTVSLRDADRDGRFEAEYSDFVYNGEYRFTFYARSRNGNMSLSPVTVMNVAGGQDIESDVIGDVSGNRIVDLTDAVLCLKILAGLPLEGQTVNLVADVDGGWEIGLEEAIFILRKVGGF